jgi:hypothetical protein
MKHSAAPSVQGHARPAGSQPNHPTGYDFICIALI